MIDRALWIEITLSEARLEFCREAVHARFESARKNNRQPRNGARISIRMDGIGILGEAAGMLYLNPVKPSLVWRFYIDGEVTDVAELDDFIDVKTTEHEHHSLIVQRGSKADWAYVLACAEHRPKILLQCWCWGHEAQQPQFWRTDTGRPAFFVPQSASCMKPMAQLRDVLRSRT